RAAPRAFRHGPGNGGRDRRAVGPSRPAEGCRRARLRLVHELREHEGPRAALVFPWFPIRRQVTVKGNVEVLDGAASDAYFATRDRRSQIGAWASPQSEVIPDRAWLEHRVEDTERRFDGVDVPRPPHWGGYRLTPHRIELWHNQPNRLHDRFRYERGESGWTLVRLAP